MSLKILLKDYPQFRTSCALFTEKLEDHNKILLSLFNKEQDTILDVGAGVEGTLAVAAAEGGYKYYPMDIDVCPELADAAPNTLLFAESLGYIDNLVLRDLISAPEITKVVIKDFWSDLRQWQNPYEYDYGSTKNFIMDLLILSGYTVNIKRFKEDMTRWNALYDATGLPANWRGNPTPKIILIATRKGN